MYRVNTVRTFLIAGCLAGLIACGGAEASVGQEAKATASPPEVTEIVRYKGLTVRNIKTAPFRVGKNTLRFEAKNTAAAQRRFAVEIRPYPGLWLKPAVTRLEIELSPAESRNVTAKFEFSKLSPYARLKVRFGENFEDSGGRTRLAGMFHELEINQTTDETEINYRFEDYKRISGDHVRLYTLPGTLAAENAPGILSVRESAIAEIEGMLDIEFDGEVYVALFPTAERKTEVTGHIGNGWAFDNVIVEVYNQDIKLDPYHELTHIISATISKAPPYLDEGFAIYVTETLGSDALEYLGAPGVKMDRAVLNYIGAGRFMPLSELVGHNIGSVYELAPVAYAEAGSLVKYLLKTYGTGKFVELYAASLPLTAENSTSQNIALLERVYGAPLAKLEKDWLASLK